MKSIDFYYDYGSPTAYLAWSQMVLTDTDKFKVSYIPVLLGGIFKATNNTPPGTVKAKANWMFRDIKMYAKKYGIHFNLNEAFPVNTLYLMRGAIFAQQQDTLEKYNKIIFEAMWKDNINLADPKNIINVLENNSFNSKAFLNAAEDELIKDKLKKNTASAVEKGIFGVPSFIVDDNLFFGQDRMHWFLN